MRAFVRGLNVNAQGWLWLAILLSPILALAGGLGFQLAGFAIGVSGIFAWVVDRDKAHYLRAIWPLTLILFVGWAWVSTLWSGYDGAFFGGNASILFGLLISLLFVPLIFLRLPDVSKRRLIWCLILTSWLGIILLIIDSASGFSLSLWGDPTKSGKELAWRLGQAEMNVGRGQISYAQLLWPVATFLIMKGKRWRLFAALSFLGLALSAYLNNLFIIIPTLVLATIFASIAWRKPRLGLILAFSLAIASLVFAPLLGAISGLIEPELMREIPLSWEHRLRMWAYSWDLIRQAPLIGHGFDASRIFSEPTFRAPDGRDITVMSLHPHNIGLQIWLETGLVGVILAVSFLLALMKTVLKACATQVRSFAATGLVVTVATSGAATIGVWQHWWWALVVLAASMIILIPSEAPELNVNTP